MKTALSFIIGFALIVGAAILIKPRWNQEAADQSVELAVDWGEVQLLNARLRKPIPEVLQALVASGVTTLLVPPQTAEELEGTPRLDRELTLRQMPAWSTRTPFEREQLRSMEVGYDPQLFLAAQNVGLFYFMRVNEDPWRTVDPIAFVSAFPAPAVRGFLFSSEDPPGGKEAAPLWADAMLGSGHQSLLFEFRPTRAARDISRRLPGQTFRAHTIPTAELKDLSPGQQWARWKRAVDERQCRFLLFRPAPNESWPEYISRLDALSAALRGSDLRLRRAISWTAQTPTSFLELNGRLLLALVLAIVTPLFALLVAWRLFKKKASAGIALAALLLITVVGGAWVAILSWMPETRLQLTPFRGVKAAILLPWLLSGAILFSWKEFWNDLRLPVRRLDLIAGLLLMGVVAYGVVRSGNAAPSMKPSMEQGVRNQLEKSFSVRPRFKEFAVGIPLLVFGFLLAARSRRKKDLLDARWPIWVGMIGPISIVNTFCHLHSPIALAFARTGMGVLLGSLLGGGLYFIYSRWRGMYEKA